MSDFNETVDKIMDSFKDEKKNRWSGKTPDGDVWVAGLLPSKKMLLVILYDNMTKKEKTVRIKEDEKEKLISMFKEMYGNDDRKTNKEDLNEDTVYDHSWYEVKGGKYPKRTKQGVIIKENFENIKVGDKLYDDNNQEYVVDEIDTTYGEDKYGNPANYISLSHVVNGKKIGGGLGMPSTGLKYIFHTKDEISDADNLRNETILDLSSSLFNETASCGATCAGSVSPVSVPMGKIAKRKRKKVSEDVDSILFKESILNDMPCESEINNHKFKYFMNEGKWYMGVDNCLVKTFDKDVMMETFDQIVDEMPVSASLLEDYSCYEMDLLMEEENTMANPTDADSDLTGNPMNATSNDETPGNSAVDSMSEDEFIANVGNKLDLLDKDDETIKSDAEIADEETHNSEILSSENQEGTIQTKDGGSIDVTIGKTETIKDKNGEDMDITHYKDNSGKEMITKTKNISKKEF